MFLKKVKSQFNQLSFRLAFTFLSFFIPCYLITFGIFYFWTAEFLKNRDRDFIDARIVQYQEIIEKEGVSGLRNLYEDDKTRNTASKYLIQLTDLSGDELFFHMSEEVNWDTPNLKTQLAEINSKGHEKWVYLDSDKKDDPSIELKTYLLNNDLRLNVGASTEVRDELLEKFQTIFITILIPLLISSVLLSIYIAKKFLKPIDNLATLIRGVKVGDFSARANLPEVEDELYDLTRAFNDMFNQIEFLLNAMKDTLDNVAHDIKTPLSRARLASEMALTSGSPEKMKIAAEESIENLDSILDMVQTIMTMSGLDSKTLELKKESFKTKEIIDEIIDLYNFVAEEKNIVLENLCDENLNVYADKLMLKQALANILDNAIKYSHNDSMIILKSYSTQKNVIFEIIDEGPGIDPQDLPRIWERLFRADKSRHEKGFGLGLSLVKIFVESNGGKVEVTSEIGKGSVFKVVMPVV